MTSSKTSSTTTLFKILDDASLVSIGGSKISKVKKMYNNTLRRVVFDKGNAELFFKDEQVSVDENGEFIATAIVEDRVISKTLADDELLVTFVRQTPSIPPETNIKTKLNWFKTIIKTYLIKK